MAIDFREKTALRIPRDSELIFLIASQATKVQATAFLNFAGSTQDIPFSHDELWNKARSANLPSGQHIAELDLDFHAASEETVSATLKIIDKTGKSIREWEEQFALISPKVGVMQYLISVK